MADGTQVGTAWIAITPSFQGFASGIASTLTGDLTQAGRRAGDSAGDAAGEAFGSSFEERASAASERLSGVGAAAGAATAGAFTLGLTAAMDASSANAKLAGQLNLTADEADRAGEVAGEVFSSGFGDSIGTVNTALAGVHASIGELGSFTDAELTQMTTDALALAETFDQDVGQATTAVGQLMKTGLADNATEAFDILTAGFQAGADRGGDLLDTITEYGTQFRNVGLSGEQAMGLISQGLQAGARDADVVADTIKEFSIEAVAGGERVSGGFESLGLSAEDMVSKFAAGGPQAAEAFDTVLDSLRGIEDPAKRNAVAIELFGTKAEDMGDALYALDPSASALENVSGAAGDLSNQLADDPSKVFSSSIRQLTTSLAEGLAPALQSAAAWTKDNQTTVVTLAAVLGGLAVAVLAVNAALRVYQATMVVVRAATTAWTAVQTALNASLWANPITLVILAIIALIAIIVACIVYWDEIVAAVRAAWAWIVEATQAAWKWLQAAFASLWGGIVSGVKAAWNWITAKITGAWALITKATSAAWSAVLATLRRIWAAITSTVSRTVGRVWSAISSAWNRVRSVTSNAFSAVRRAIGNALQRALSVVRNIGSRFWSVGRNIVMGIVRGVGSAAGALYSRLRNLASSALSAAKNFLGISSPSRLFADQIGQWIPAGVELGIERGEPELAQRIEHMVQVPDTPTIRAAVATGPAAEPAPVVIRADGNRASRVLVELLQHSVRTELGGDVNRLGDRR